MERYLGLDLGTASLGWSLIDFDGGDRGKIVASGVRIFPEAIEGKKEEAKKTKNTARRNFRLGRRQTRRTRLRKEGIKTLLHGAGLLPNDEQRVLEKPSEHFTTQKGKLGNIGLPSPYELRQKALDEKIDLNDLGRIFFHLSRRIGFSGAIIADDESVDKKELTEEEKKQAADDKKAEDERKDLDKAIKDSGKKTLGAYLANEETQRGRHLSRQMLLDEFEAIWGVQQKFYPDILTPNLKSSLHGKIFDRQRVFWRWKTIGICALEPDSPLLLKAEWLAQQSTMLQDLNNIYLETGNRRPLDKKERALLLDLFQQNANVTFGNMRKTLKEYWASQGTPLDAKFNFEMGADSRDGLSGNATEAMLRKVLGESFPSHPKADIIRKEIVKRKWRIRYEETTKGFHPKFKSKRIEIRGKAEEIEAAKNDFIASAVKDWGITPEEATQLADYDRLPQGWTRHSEKVIEGLVSGMGDGTKMTDVLDKLYPRQDRLLGEGDGMDILPSHHRHLPDIRNPVVTRCLNETRKVVNNIIRTYGKPDHIRIEMARDVKLAGKKKRAALRKNKERRKLREDARKFLKDNKLPTNDGMILKYMLWKETNERDLYSGDRVGADELFKQGKYEIEHIMPRSISRDDSFNNLLLCRRDYNQKKGNRIPFKAFGNSPEWEDMVSRVKEQWPTKSKKGGINPKRSRFLREEYADSDEREQAQLSDTAYAARAARDFLACLYPKGEAIDWQKGRPPRVLATNGQITSQLGKAWNVYRHFSKWFGDETQNKKLRDDHRHHALDATIIALTDPYLVREIAQRYNDMREKGIAYEKIVESLNFRPPWEGFHEELKTSLSNIMVSYKVDSKISGALTKQGQLGRIKGEEHQFVQRVSLTDLTWNKFLGIRDENVKSILWEHLRKHEPELPANWLNLEKQEKAKVKSAIEKVFQGGDIPYTYKKDGTRHFPIKKVRTAVKQDAHLTVKAKTPNSVYLKGDNHHTALYKKPDGEIEVLSVNKMMAIQRVRQGKPIVSPYHPDNPDWPLVFSFCKRDMLKRIDPDTGEVSYHRVEVLGEEKATLYPQYDASKSNKIKKQRHNRILIAKGYQKVSVDPIGRVRKAK